MFFKIRRAVLNDAEKLDISRSQLGFIPDELREYPELSRLTSLNLCRNQLFNSASAPATPASAAVASGIDITAPQANTYSASSARSTA